ncbi:uncharacterized protein CEXT_650721 [Caerostris extrusa]|uniref:Essential protein Yae1 N-terminal domain-containing protein n=1 Tax=Caerostris extrusa TaxID=172846 RepID=A0AAV4XLJ1_CAEEX|nr:uncharacterized protein CEXT_650721 [Caerostris extrusa]
MSIGNKHMEIAVCVEMNEMDPEIGSTIEEVEWKKLKIARLKDGYADGKFMGSQTAKESGEKHGYAKGLEDSFNYTLSMAMGLLGVNQCILRNLKSPLLPRAKEIKISLDNFMKKYNNLRMTEVQFRNESFQEEINFDVSDVQDENSNVPDTEIQHESTLLFPKFIHTKNLTVEDLSCLKSEVLKFLQQCHQPMLLDQMTRIFENLGHLLMQSTLNDQNNTDISSKKLSEST